MANSQGDRNAFATPRSSTWIVLNCILFIIGLIPAAGDLTRDCLVFLKDRQVSSFGCFVFDFWVLCFPLLGAPFSSFGCSVFNVWVLSFWVLGASFLSFGYSVFEFSRLHLERYVGSGTRFWWKFLGQCYMAFCLFLRCPWLNCTHSSMLSKMSSLCTS